MSSRPSPGFKRLCVWVSAIAVGIISIGLACLLYILVPGFIDVAQHPHRPAYAVDPQVASLTSQLDLTKVIRPLIGSESRFDLLASVYINATGTASPEDCIFSEVVLRDLDVTSKESTEVDLQIPLAPFKGLKITMDDFMKGAVRASFTLIPHGSDKLRTRSFKSYLDGLGFNRPTRPGFPHPDLLGRSIDQNAASDTLVLYVQKERKCEFDFEDEEEESGHYTLANELARKVVSHPRLKTHSWVVMVRDENVYKLQEFNRMQDQNHDMMVRCRDGFDGTPQLNCDRSFANVGNFRHKLAVEGQDSSGKKKSHWLYAPYIFVPTTSAGPMDSAPIPVQVEDCEDLTPIDVDQDIMNLKWTVAFSSLTPAKVAFLQGLAGVGAKSWVDDDLTQRSQDVNEMLNVVVGHKYDPEVRPLLRFIVSALSVLLGSILIPLLNLHYWLTRKSVTGIALDSMAIIRTLSALFMIRKLDISRLSLAVSASVPAFIQFWAISLLGLRWSMKILPSGIETRSPSASEQKSIQSYKAISSQTKLAVWCLSLAICLLDTYTNLHFFAIGGPPPIIARPDSFIGHVITVLALSSSFWIKLLQLYFNHISGTFAGDHRITALLNAAAAGLDLSMCSSTLMGNWSAYRGLTVQKLAIAALAFCNFWQSLTLPTVQQSESLVQPVKEE